MTLDTRDRTALMIGALAVGLFVFLQFVVFPLAEKQRRLERGIAVREKSVQEMRDMQERYRQLHARVNSLQVQLEKRSPDFSLFSFLEKMATMTGVKERIVYMKPSTVQGDGPFRQNMVEMKLQGISLQQLVDLLKMVEAPENIVAIKRITIQENKKEQGMLDVIMQVVTVERTAEAGG
ncbi:type 4a pilus biogenesis protein PilO [Desulfolithobacter sp.]